MKKAMTAAMVGLFLGVCVSAQAGYRTEVKVTPSAEPHHFVVEFKIIQAEKGGKTDVLSAPKMVVKAGEEGQVKIVGDEKEQTGVFCTALVKETNGGIETTTSVTVKEKGSEKLNHSQTTAMSKPAATVAYEYEAQLLAMPSCEATLQELPDCVATLKTADGSVIYIGSPASHGVVHSFVQSLEVGKGYHLPTAFMDYRKTWQKKPHQPNAGDGQ
jgi:hypothetical protein